MSMPQFLTIGIGVFVIMLILYIMREKVLPKQKTEYVNETKDNSVEEEKE